MADINIYTIPEEYKPTWDDGIITAITQQSAGLTSVAKQVSPNGEYHEMTTRGGLTIDERKSRHEDKPDGQELKMGNRRFYPNMFAATAWLSRDDFKLKGRLPLALGDLRDALKDAAQPLPDRVLLGVTDPSTAHKGNTLIASAETGNQGEKSPYGGIRQGIMGINWTGLHGTEKEYLPQQPIIGDALATSYADYASSMDGLDLAKTNVIPVNYSLSGTPEDTGITYEKLLALRLALMQRHIMTGHEEFCMAITPMQLIQMQNSEMFKNALYRDALQLQADGTYIHSMLNIRFKVTVDVPIVNIGTSSNQKWVRACPVWRASSVMFGTWSNPEYELEKLQRKYDTVECTVQFAYGAGRRRLEDVLTMHCYEDSLAGLSVS